MSFFLTEKGKYVIIIFIKIKEEGIIMTKTGLIMEGGAMRGMFTAGVIDVLMENDIEFDGGIGVSAGACFGCNYKSKQIGRVIRYNMKYCNDKRYSSLRSLILTGDLYGADFCYRELPEKLDVFDNETYNNNPMEFYVTCTDINTGEAIYKKCDTTEGNLLEWIRASASLPLVSRVVKVDGYELLDGGIADSIPVRYFESIGYNKNVVILTQPKDYIKKKNEFMPIIKLAMRKYPKLIEALAKRHEVYNETIEYINEKEEKGELFVIRPSKKLQIGKMEHNPEKLKAVYDIGRYEAEKNLDKIKEFLNK